MLSVVIASYSVCYLGIKSRNVGRRKIPTSFALEMSCKQNGGKISQVFSKFRVHTLINSRVYIKGSKNWYTGKVIAYGSYFYFAPDAAENFLERELGKKRGVSWGQ